MPAEPRGPRSACRHRTGRRRGRDRPSSGSSEFPCTCKAERQAWQPFQLVVVARSVRFHLPAPSRRGVDPLGSIDVLVRDRAQERATSPPTCPARRAMARPSPRAPAPSRRGAPTPRRCSSTRSLRRQPDRPRGPPRSPPSTPRTGTRSSRRSACRRERPELRIAWAQENRVVELAQPFLGSTGDAEELAE